MSAVDVEEVIAAPSALNPNAAVFVYKGPEELLVAAVPQARRTQEDKLRVFHDKLLVLAREAKERIAELSPLEAHCRLVEREFVQCGWRRSSAAQYNDQLSPLLFEVQAMCDEVEGLIRELRQQVRLCIFLFIRSLK